MEMVKSTRLPTFKPAHLLFSCMYLLRQGVKYRTLIPAGEVSLNSTADVIF